MIFAASPYGTTPWSRTAHSDQSTQPLIASLLANPDLNRFYLLQLEPYDWNAEQTVTRHYGAGISRLPGTTALWRPFLVDAFNVQTQLFEGPFGSGEGGRVSFGTINIGIGEEAETHWIFRDEFSWLNWNRRSIKLYMGGDPKEPIRREDGSPDGLLVNWTFNDYVLIFSGLAEEATWTEDVFSLIVRDPMVRLEAPLQTTFYLGTADESGGNRDEGGEDLRGQPKPICYGRPRAISPVLIDRLHLVFQIHDGPVLEIGAVYDKGDLYENDGDFVDSTALRAWNGPPGKFATCLAQGLFRLGSSPNGVVVADAIRGDSDAGVLREKQGELINRILKSRIGLIPEQIDGAALAALDANGREVSFYTSDVTTVAEVIDAILQPAGFRTFDSEGRFTAGRVAIGTPQMTLAAPRIVSLARVRTRLPTWRLSLGYARNWTVLTETDIAAAGAEFDKDFAINEYRRVVKTDATVQTRQPGAFDDTIDTLWNDQSDAQAELDALFDLVKADRDLYEVRAQHIQFMLRVGQTIRLQHERFGLRSGSEFIVLGVAENTSLGETKLWLWG